MSTKTTIKRIALVYVSALGFGKLSAVTSNAITVGTHTLSLSLSNSSLTVVSTTSGLTNASMFSIDLIDDKWYPPQGLFGKEYISVTIVAIPTYRAAGITPATLAKVVLRVYKVNSMRSSK